MDRQPLGRLALLAALLGCGDDPLGDPAFDGPGAVAVLDPLEGGPFDEPIGFVASTRDGAIVPIDLKRGILLGDQVGGPFLAPRKVATGDQRQLGQIAVYAPDGSTIRLFAADLAEGVLVEAPYLLPDAEGVAAPPPLLASAPVFEDADNSGDSVEVADLRVRHGYTTTEAWTFTYDGELWTATGSRSGLQARTFRTGEDWHASRREVELRLTGTASAGDVVRFSTDAGLVEHDLGGLVLGLTEIPGSTLLAAGVWDAGAGQGFVSLFDMAAGEVVGEVLLPSGAQPYQFATSADGSELFVGDAQRAAVYRVALDPADPGAAVAVELPTQGPISALAWVSDEADPYSGEPAYRHLFVGLALDSHVDVYDLDAEAWIDVNPYDDWVGGLDVRSPIAGMSASTESILLQTYANNEGRDDGQVVLLTTFDGSVRMFEGRSGCFAMDLQGPRVATSSGGVESVSFSDRGLGSNPVFYSDLDTARRLIFQDCGGVARSETWKVMYDGIAGNWRVEGTVSGEQVLRAEEGERYLSDEGAISFLLLGGSAPSTDGDTFTFRVAEGILRINTVLATDGTTPIPLELPAAPLVFSMESGPEGGGWDPYDVRQYALIPATNSDLVARIRLQAWQVEATWE